MPRELQVEIWSDIACPWCYVGKRHFEAALADFRHREAVRVRWRAFELDPKAPRTLASVDSQGRAVSYLDRLAKKYGTTLKEAQAMVDRMSEVARGVGLDFHFENIQPGNSFDAHRLLHLAAERGVQDALKERLLKGYLSEGAAIGDPSTLLSLATEGGPGSLDPEEVRSLLEGERFADEVRADEAEARSLGISGVPFFVIGRYGVSGAQPAALLLQVLEKSWEEEPPKSEATPENTSASKPSTESEPNAAPIAEGASCGLDGC